MLNAEKYVNTMVLNDYYNHIPSYLHTAIIYLYLQGTIPKKILKKISGHGATVSIFGLFFLLVWSTKL